MGAKGKGPAQDLLSLRSFWLRLISPRIACNVSASCWCKLVPGRATARGPLHPKKIDFGRGSRQSASVQVFNTTKLLPVRKPADGNCAGVWHKTKYKSDLLFWPPVIPESCLRFKVGRATTYTQTNTTGFWSWQEPPPKK